jgi:hypothetical protein
MPGLPNDATAETFAPVKTINNLEFCGARDPDDGEEVAGFGGDDVAGHEADD